MTRNLATSIFLFSSLVLMGCGHSGNQNSADKPHRTGDVLTNGDADADDGQQLINERHFAKAIPHLERALEKRVTRYSKSDLLTSIGNCYYELNQLETALEYHDKAIDEDPNNHRAYVNKGVVYRLVGSYDKAAESYSKALVLAPDYAELHGNMGTLAVFQGNYVTAVKHLKRSIELDDSHPVAHSNLALAYASLGRFDEADQELKKAVLRGYHQPEVIKKRVETLRNMSDGSKKSGQR